MTRPRRSLFVKYFVTLFVAVVVPLALGSATEAWFAFRDNRFDLDEILRVEARSAADRIQAFTDGIRDQLGWVVQFPWSPGEDERRKTDGLRLLQQVPAIVSLSLVDAAGTERVFVSRVSMNRTGRGADMSADPAVIGARANRVWYGPVHFQRDSEPYMRIAVAGNRAAAGIVVADINLKLIWDIIAAIRIGDTGHVLVVDDFGVWSPIRTSASYCAAGQAVGISTASRPLSVPRMDRRLQRRERTASRLLRSRCVRPTLAGR